MTTPTKGAKKAAEEIKRLAEELDTLGHSLLIGSAWEVDHTQVAAIIARHTRDGELREALRKLADTTYNIGGQHSESYRAARALLAALDAEGFPHAD